MKPEKDDAPDYLNNKNKPDHGKTWFFIGIGSAITWVLVALFARPIVVDVDKLKQAIRFADEPVQQTSIAMQPVTQARMIPAPEAVRRREEEFLRREAERVRQERAAQNYIIRYEPGSEQPTDQRSNNAPRQTSFNDSNYIRRSDINTIQLSQPVHYAANTMGRSGQSAPRRRNNHAYWTWVGANRQSQTISIEWMTANGAIEYRTVCHNHRAGSIEYRDCRKAAKEYFRHRCSSSGSQTFCLAEHRYYP